MSSAPRATSIRLWRGAKRLLLCLLVFPAQAAAAESSCELHVWPASASGANTGGWLSNLGAAGALVDYERNKDANLRDQVALIEALTPVVQARVLADAGLPALLDISEAHILFHSEPMQPRSVRKDKERRTTSSATCYAELIVSLNFYQKSAVYGRTLASHLTFKDFRGGRDKARMKSAKVRSPVTHFPPATPEDQALAQRDLEQAFAANIRDFAKKLAD